MSQASLNDPLLLQFSRHRPDDVAALLGNSDAAELVEFIDGLPDEVAAGIAVRTPSWQLATLVAQLDPARLCSMITSAPTDEAIALISHIHASRYTTLTSACPADRLDALQRLLEFPSHSVAALVTTHFIRVTADTLCGSFADQLSNNPRPQGGPVLVVDKRGKYLGMADLQRVYARRNRARPIGEVASEVEPLNGLTEVATVSLSLPSPQSLPAYSISDYKVSHNSYLFIYSEAK